MKQYTHPDGLLLEADVTDPATRDRVRELFGPHPAAGPADLIDVCLMTDAHAVAAAYRRVEEQRLGCALHSVYVFDVALRAREFANALQEGPIEDAE